MSRALDDMIVCLANMFFSRFANVNLFSRKIRESMTFHCKFAVVASSSFFWIEK